MGLPRIWASIVHNHGNERCGVVFAAYSLPFLIIVNPCFLMVYVHAKTPCPFLAQLARRLRLNGSVQTGQDSAGQSYGGRAIRGRGG